MERAIDAKNTDRPQIALLGCSYMIAGWCEQIGRDPWSISIGPDHEQAMESGFFRDERWREDGLCDFHHEDEPPLIAAGTYTLVGGIMWGSPGDPSVGFDLSSCVAIDVTIASETIVDLPPFEPCEVRLGDSDADPWRHSLEVDPTTPGVGTLQIELDSMAMQPPFEEYNGNLEVVVLQAGTTLNQVGRQQIWPVGAVSAPLVK